LLMGERSRPIFCLKAEIRSSFPELYIFRGMTLDENIQTNEGI
jgi:hypothetical protein